MRRFANWLTYVLFGDEPEHETMMAQEAEQARAEISRAARSFENAASQAYLRGDDRLTRQVMKASDLTR